DDLRREIWGRVRLPWTVYRQARVSRLRLWARSVECRTCTSWTAYDRTRWGRRATGRLTTTRFQPRLPQYSLSGYQGRATSRGPSHRAAVVDPLRRNRRLRQVRLPGGSHRIPEGVDPPAARPRDRHSARRQVRRIRRHPTRSHRLQDRAAL